MIDDAWRWLVADPTRFLWLVAIVAGLVFAAGMLAVRNVTRYERATSPGRRASRRIRRELGGEVTARIRVKRKRRGKIRKIK